MEGVGARLGRSSTRYGPTSTVFNGPVRKWKKKWVQVSPSTNASSNHHSQTANNGSANGSNGSHLLLYKWTPITQSQNNNGGSNGDKSSAKDEVAAAAAAACASEEPPRRKFKYTPIALLEEQKDEAAENEAAEKVDDEAKPSDDDEAKPSDADPKTSTSDGLDEKPDINDVPMEESQAPSDAPLQRQDLNESTLDLSLGLKSHDGEPDSDAKTDQLERLNPSSTGT